MPSQVPEKSMELLKERIRSRGWQRRNSYQDSNIQTYCSHREIPALIDSPRNVWQSWEPPVSGKHYSWAIAINIHPACNIVVDPSHSVRKHIHWECSEGKFSRSRNPKALEPSISSLQPPSSQPHLGALPIGKSKLLILVVSETSCDNILKTHLQNRRNRNGYGLCRWECFAK